jgi:hypothetical protein
MTENLPTIPGGVYAKVRLLTGHMLEDQMPEIKELILGLYRGGVLDYGEIAGQVVQFLPKESDFHFDLAGQVRSIVTRNITADEADSIVRNGGLMLVAEGVVKARELLGSCDEKQIGNIAALIKSVNEVVNLRNGKATKITAKEQPAGKSFAELRAEAQASLKKKEPERIIDVSEMVDVPELEEIEDE